MYDKHWYWYWSGPWRFDWFDGLHHRYLVYFFPQSSLVCTVKRDLSTSWRKNTSNVFISANRLWISLNLPFTNEWSYQSRTTKNSLYLCCGSDRGDPFQKMLIWFELNITEHIFKSLPDHVSHKDLSFQQSELLQFHRVKRHIKQDVVPPESERPPGRGNWQ